MKQNRKFLLYCLLVVAGVLVLTGFIYYRILVRYRTAQVEELSALYGVVHEVYPDVPDEELLSVLRGDRKPAPEDTDFLSRYSIDADELHTPSARIFTRSVWVLGVCSILLLAGLLTGLYVLRYRRIHNKMQELIDYVHDVSLGLYDLKIEDSSEDTISRLSAELYKVTVLLRETAELNSTRSLALSRSLEDISHQLKTPLTSIRIMLDNIEETPDMPADIRADFLNSISQQVSLISKLVISLLHLARFDSGQVAISPEPVLLQDLLEEVISNLSVMADVKNIAFDLTGDLSAVHTMDHRWEAEAISNIVKNAIEHSPDGSTVHLAVEDTPLFVKLSIRDEGEGISREDQQHIFERFYKAQNSSSSSIGIGLSFAKAVVEKDDGYITVDSAEGEGTTFTIRWKK